MSPFFFFFYAYNVQSIYEVGTNPSSKSFILLTLVHPSPWSTSIRYNSSPSYIGIDPSLVAKNKKKIFNTPLLIFKKFNYFHCPYLQMDIKPYTFLTDLKLHRHKHRSRYFAPPCCLDRNQADSCETSPGRIQDCARSYH